jgi:hypothetical protein
MGMFAETANVGYCFRLPTKGNKLPFSFTFRRKTNGSLPFPFFICSKQKEVAIFC